MTAQPPPGGPPDTAGVPAAPPTCYRHPDRETWVACTRCDRSICPEDMHEASVGFQCPDCVREGNRSVRKPRTALGGRVTPSSGVGRVTLGVIVLDVLVFLLQRSDPTVTGRFAMQGFAIADGEWFRLLTAAFLHGSLFHLLSNMYALYLFGPQLEATLGRLRYVVLFVLSALGGSAASFLMGDPLSRGVGASGAVFGLLGAMYVVARRQGLETGPLLFLLAINLALPLLLPQLDWRAHLGGLVTGGVLAAAWAAPVPRARRDLVQLAAALAVAALIAAVVLLRTAALVG